MKFRGYMLLVFGLVFGGALFSQAQKEKEEKTPVDIKADVAYRTPELEENAIVMTGNVVFHHNGTVIVCDSAVRYSDRRIDCFKNVIINKDSTFVYGDRAEYNGDLNIARVYSPVIKVIDGDATLYTYNFVFNTKTNVGKWSGGGVMYQKDNVMESEVGYFYSDLHELVAARAVQMKNDSHQIISDSVRYNTETKIATFYTRTYIWTEDSVMIRADRGRYNTQDSTYFFWRDAYVLDEFRETWADTIDFNARTEDIWMYGNIQIDDNEHESSAFGDYGRYWGERGETMLTKLPSLLNYNEDQGNQDTMYMRADTVFMFVIYPSDRRRHDSLAGAGGEGERPDPVAHLRWLDSLPDSVRLAKADSLAPIVARLRTERDSLAGRADSIMNALYPPPPPPPPPPPDSLREGNSPPAREGWQSERLTGWADSLPRPDSLPQLYSPPVPDSLPVIDTLLVADTLPPPLPPPVPAPEPERIETPEVRGLRTAASGLTARIDSLQTVVNYLRPAPGEGVLSPADSLARMRADSLACADSLARVDSLRTADPKAFKKLEKASKKAQKEEQRRLKAEAKEAKRAEKERLREEKRAAKAAARAKKAIERRRRAAAKRGLVFVDADSLARADSILIRDSLLRLDSLFRLDSLARVDSLAAVADTAATAEPDTTMRIFRGWYNVKIWREDMQAVCDSMVGFSADSTIHLYTKPVLWNGESQIVADSITVYTSDGNVERAEFYGNPIMSSQLAHKQFNQVVGKTMTSRFRDSEVYRHDVDGNVQALYYLQEDGDPDPVAFLVMSSSNMTFLIENDSLRYIIPREQVEWPIYPIGQIPATQPTELKGFRWYIDRKPSLEDVFTRRVRPTERAFHESLPRPEFPIAARIDRRREYLVKNRMWGDRIDPLPAHAVEYVRSLPQE